MSGFCKTGIFPLNRLKVIERLPHEHQADPLIDAPAVDAAVMEVLQTLLYGEVTDEPRRKIMRLNVIPGKSVTLDVSSTSESEEDDQESENHEEDEDIPKLPVFPRPDTRATDGTRHAARACGCPIRFP